MFECFPSLPQFCCHTISDLYVHREIFIIKTCKWFTQFVHNLELLNATDERFPIQNIWKDSRLIIWHKAVLASARHLLRFIIAVVEGQYLKLVTRKRNTKREFTILYLYSRPHNRWVVIDFAFVSYIYHNWIMLLQETLNIVDVVILWCGLGYWKLIKKILWLFT